jgi:hypothetical protein
MPTRDTMDVISRSESVSSSSLAPFPPEAADSCCCSMRTLAIAVGCGGGRAIICLGTTGIERERERQQERKGRFRKGREKERERERESKRERESGRERGKRGREIEHNIFGTWRHPILSLLSLPLASSLPLFPSLSLSFYLPPFPSLFLSLSPLFSLFLSLFLSTR